MARFLWWEGQLSHHPIPIRLLSSFWATGSIRGRAQLHGRWRSEKGDFPGQQRLAARPALLPHRPPAPAHGVKQAAGTAVSLSTTPSAGPAVEGVPGLQAQAAGELAV